MLDKKISQPLYLQLAEDLLHKIEAGEIRSGEKLPSESEMMEQYEVGRLTVRNALKQLVDGGYLTKRQGQGTFCRSAAPESYLNIEVILDMENVYFVPYYVRGISAVLRENNCNFLISNSSCSVESICLLLEQILHKGASGVILQLTPTDSTPELDERLQRCLHAFRRRKIPVILIDSTLEGDEYSYCAIDERSGGARAAEHLAAFGHRRCAVVYRPECLDGKLRFEGFRQAAVDFGMRPPVPIRFAKEPDGSLVQAVREQSLTGVFCYNDDVALQCMQALKSAGYRIPEDVSVIGFDDSYLATTAVPPLTTLSHPKETLGRRTMQALLQLIRGEIDSPYHKLFEVALVRRESCARAKDVI